jgi:hypothetical protein
MREKEPDSKLEHGVELINIRTYGGFGDQMFQYAAARRLSILHETELLFEMSSFQNRQLH